MPALLTPFTPDDRVDTNALVKLVTFLLDGGVHGFYVCGATGEGITMTEEERQLVAQTVVKTVGGRVPVIIHVGSPSTLACQRLARHAESVGASAVASVPPFFYPVGNQGVEEHYRQIAAATKLPLYVYNLPGATGVNVGADIIRRLFADGVIAGVKYTSPDLLGFRDIIEGCGSKINLFCGPDEMLLPFLVMGAHGGIGSTYNPMPRIYARLFKAWQAGDLKTAQELQYFIDRYILALFKYGVMPSVKATMGFLGVEVGECRRPFLPMPADKKAALRRDLEAIDFFKVAGR
jgi:N-acetylneuraminate lyase